MKFYCIILIYWLLVLILLFQDICINLLELNKAETEFDGFSI